MAKVLVLYYSMYGHIETMAHAVAEGANKVDGVEVVVKRVPETMQAEAFAKAGGKTQNAPVATPQELADYDAIIFGTPPVLAICQARCAPSSIRRAGCGPLAHCTANSPACSAPPGPAEPGTDDYLSLDYPCSSWDGDCTDWLWRAGTV